MNFQWISVDTEMPDSDQTVLIVHAWVGESVTGLPAVYSEPVWLGYHDGEEWRTAEGEVCEVSHWSHLPAPPEANP